MFITSTYSGVSVRLRSPNNACTCATSPTSIAPFMSGLEKSRLANGSPPSKPVPVSVGVLSPVIIPAVVPPTKPSKVADPAILPATSLSVTPALYKNTSVAPCVNPPCMTSVTVSLVSVSPRPSTRCATSLTAFLVDALSMALSKAKAPNGAVAPTSTIAVVPAFIAISCAFASISPS